MKSLRIILYLLVTLIIAGKANAQMSLTIFSENGEKFTAYVNGSKKNTNPASRVETDRPGGPSFKVRISFDDNSIPEISKSIFNSPGADMFYVIKKSSHGKFVIEKTSYEYAHRNEGSTTKEEKSSTKTEKSKSEEPKSEAKSSGGGDKGCSGPMDEGSFISSREMISNAPFDGPKLSHAKKLADEHCLTTSQIIDVIYVFSGESSRLSFAKHAYKHCYDPKNYDRVKDVLRHSSQDDLQRYIDSQK
jgi:hypothetical protein